MQEYWVRQVGAATTTAVHAVGVEAAGAAAEAGSSMNVVQLIDLALNGGALPGEDPTGVLSRREFAVARRVTGA